MLDELLAAVSVEDEEVSVAVLLAGVVVELMFVAGSSLVEGVVGSAGLAGLAGSSGVALGMSSYQMVQMELLVTSP